MIWKGKRVIDLLLHRNAQTVGVTNKGRYITALGAVCNVPLFITTPFLFDVMICNAL